MQEIIEYIKPELLVLIPVLYFIGIGLKKSSLADKHIPLVLGVLGIVLAAIWVLATSDIAGYQSVLTALFTAIVQGILCAGCSVFANQLWKQESTKTNTDVDVIDEMEE